jgi:hypothetical protein
MGQILVKIAFVVISIIIIIVNALKFKKKGGR